MDNLQGYLMTSSTGENCTADELRDECKLIALAFRKFLGYALVKKHSNIIGASRGTEVTYSPATGYNPHTHVILGLKVHCQSKAILITREYRFNFKDCGTERSSVVEEIR